MKKLYYRHRKCGCRMVTEELNKFYRVIEVVKIGEECLSGGDHVGRKTNRYDGNLIVAPLTAIDYMKDIKSRKK